MICVSKQGEVIQTAVNFIKKPHFKVPEQAFCFTPGLSPAFIFASTLAGLACVYGVSFGALAGLPQECTFRIDQSPHPHISPSAYGSLIVLALLDETNLYLTSLRRSAVDDVYRKKAHVHEQKGGIVLPCVKEWFGT